MSRVKLTNVRKSFGKNEIIKGVDLEVENREFIVFVGPSGCGKSTLLRLISGLEDVSHGSIYIDGVEVTTLAPSKRGIAMVFQSYALFPHMTVAENMSFGLKLSKTPKQDIVAKVNDAASILQITHLLTRMPKQLSGGQRQRVAIGRSIVRNPKVFLFDEPLSNLDAALRVKMRVEIARLHNEIGATMIYVTHDQVEAMTLADRIVVLNDGQIEQQGSPMELYNDPVNKFVAGFIGSPTMNFIQLDAKGETGDTQLKLGEMELKLKTTNPLTENTVTLGIRPEDIKIQTKADNNHCQAKLVVLEKLGSETLLYVKIPNITDLLTIRLGQEVVIEKDTDIWFNFKPDDCYLFDKEDKRIY